MDRFYAHIAPDGRMQPVKDHLEGTAARAAEFAKDFNAEEFGYLAGIAHDIGKYSRGFQLRLHGGQAVDHSSAGALECAMMGADLSGICVAGHHGGLPDYGNVTADFSGDGTYVARIRKAYPERCKFHSGWTDPLPTVPSEPDFAGDGFARSLWCRMLFSSLVDADFLDTEAFMRNGQVLRGSHDSLPVLYRKLNALTAKRSRPVTELDRMRSSVLEDCRKAADSDRGLFTLTVPTGGGKTVSSLAFALKHAIRNGMKRIIYVIPYTSVIEQNAEVFRTIVGAENVIEHHSEAELTESGDLAPGICRKALAAENWEAPIIVTTAVQFFESLYANRPSKCRKLHNIANSVIIFDEAQMIPTGHLRPCVAVIANLVAHFNASAVLCTATQPFLSDLFSDYAPKLKITEIHRNPAETCSLLRRVTYCNAGTLSADQIADELSSCHQVLCIVNTRKGAREIFSRLSPEGSFHLSTLMYPAHRQKVLSEIRRRLKEDLPCRVVSTSLIEAGVDIDFPLVFREIAGIDSIVQAAGRCNREGKRKTQDSIVTVFECDSLVPGLMRMSIGAARETLSRYRDLNLPEAIAYYFAAYRSFAGTGLDKSNAVRHLSEGICGCMLPFQTVAEHFRMIGNDTKTVYIPCEQSRPLLDEIISGTASRAGYRRAGRYGVNVFGAHYDALLLSGDIIEIDSQSAYLKNVALYDSETGLSLAADWGKAEFV